MAIPAAWADVPRRLKDGETAGRQAPLWNPTDAEVVRFIASIYELELFENNCRLTVCNRCLEPRYQVRGKERTKCTMTPDCTGEMAWIRKQA